MLKPHRSDAFAHAARAVVPGLGVCCPRFFRGVLVRQLDDSAARAAYLKSP